MREADPRLLDEICQTLSARRKPIWIGIHRLRAWRSGNRIHVDFHLILPRDLSLEAAHAEVREVEDILYAGFGSDADVLIHADPCDTPQCPECGYGSVPVAGRRCGACPPVVRGHGQPR
jgi:divalent metal cation (Fe/Co/Zn/Cd) transporter